MMRSSKTPASCGLRRPICHVPRAALLTFLSAVVFLVAIAAPGQAQNNTSTRPATSPSTGPADSSPLDLVLKIAGETDPKTRREAALAILKMSDAESTRTLLKLFESKNNDPAKLAVCEALAESRSQNAEFIPPLLALLDQKEAGLRKAAVAALGNYRDPVVAEKVKAAVQQHDAQLLAENHAALMKALYDSTADAERAALLLNWLKQPLGLERFTALEIVQQALRKGAPDGAVLDQVRTLLADSDEAVRQKAVLVLRTRGLREDAPRIRALLRQEPSELVRDAIYSALGVLGDPASIPVVAEGLKDTSEQVVVEAATALGQLGELQPAPSGELLATAVQALLERASGPRLENAKLRERIIDAMSRIADPKFLPVLVQHAGADEPVPAIRQAAVRGLGRVNDAQQAAVVIARLSTDIDPGVREVAAEALGRLGVDVGPLKALRERLDPKLETSAAVQDKAWESYALIFLKLPAADQKTVMASWPAADPGAVTRRIELLIHLEKAMSNSKYDPPRLTMLREELADALVAASRPADAAPVLARGLETLAADQSAVRRRLTLKLVETQLNGSTPEKAIATAAGLETAELKEAVAARLLKYAQVAAKKDRAAAADFLTKLKQSVPDQFGPPWTTRFEELRVSASSKPATAPTGK